MSALTGDMTHAGGKAQSDTASTEHISTVACVKGFTRTDAPEQKGSYQSCR